MAANFHSFRILSNVMADYLLSVVIKIFRTKFKNVYFMKTVNVKYHAIVFHTTVNYRKTYLYTKKSYN